MLGLGTCSSGIGVQTALGLPLLKATLQNFDVVVSSEAQRKGQKAGLEGVTQHFSTLADLSSICLSGARGSFGYP